MSILRNDISDKEESSHSLTCYLQASQPYYFLDLKKIPDFPAFDKKS
jgi:hypothetical protein